MDYNEKLYNVFSNKEHRLESWMAAVFSKEYDHNVTIDELKEILAEENSFIVTELKEVEKENYIRENSKWEVILKAEYIEEYDDRGHELDSYNTNAGWEDVEANDGTFMGMLMQKAADNSSRDYQLLYYDPRTHPHKLHK